MNGVLISKKAAAQEQLFEVCKKKRLNGKSTKRVGETLCGACAMISQVTLAPILFVESPFNGPNPPTLLFKSIIQSKNHRTKADSDEMNGMFE